MTDIAIRVENLSKLYHIGMLQQRHDTLRDALTGFLPRIARIPRKGEENSLNSPNSRQASTSDELWALRDVSFEVKRGEVVGIIGRNGAGKSTLLKILSRITEPTSGHAEIHGRVGSLLEVGTGFHPELTGRENIYLNGAILGMKRTEIARQFDEIVAFAEIERFLDTPVKRYSSGMYVRLAFAVAAHLEPEILLVDEVLAVGDAAFQEKCLGKMDGVARQGRTILFVSHNLSAVERLCPKSILLDSGEIISNGLSVQVTSLHRQLSRAGVRSSDNGALSNASRVELLAKGSSGQETDSWAVGDSVSLIVRVPESFFAPNLAIDIAFYTPDRVRIFYVRSDAIPRGYLYPSNTHAIYRLTLENPGVVVPTVIVDVGLRYGREPYSQLYLEAYTLHVPPVTSMTDVAYEGIIAPRYLGEWL